MEYRTLSNGVKMPALGYGVYQTPASETKRCVLDAIDVGYRSFDTAQAYGNEAGVGDALASSHLPRQDFFVTTKIWISNAGYEKAKASIGHSLKLLKSDYVDLLLIHQPFGDYYGTYRAMEEAYAAGKARAIGISNFPIDRFIDLCHFVTVKPMVDQAETHVFQQQQELRGYLEKEKTQLMSWGPFAEGKHDYFKNPTLLEIGKAHQKSAAQVALRFLLQRGVIVIPKSTHKERMVENFSVFDFTLTPEEMAQIQNLDEKKSLFFSHQDPSTVEWFMSIV